MSLFDRARYGYLKMFFFFATSELWVTRQREGKQYELPMSAGEGGGRWGVTYTYGPQKAQR